MSRARMIGVGVNPRTPVDKHNEIILATRRKKVAEMYLKGETQVDIGIACGVTQKTVSLDLAVIRQTWKDNAIGDFSIHVLEQIAKLDLLESTHWAAWIRSCESAETRTITREKVRPKYFKRLENTDQDEDNISPDEEPLVITKELIQKSLKGQVGDVRFLQEIREITNMRLKLIGAYPKETNNKIVFNINWEEMAEGDTEEDPIARRLREVEEIPSDELDSVPTPVPSVVKKPFKKPQ